MRWPPKYPIGVHGVICVGQWKKKKREKEKSETKNEAPDLNEGKDT